MKMSAPRGNKYAEKWTKEAALEFLEGARNEINEKCYFLSEVAERCGEYPDLFHYLLKKFGEDDEVFRAIKRVQGKCESMITRKTAEGKIVPSLGIFILKSYHNLVETSRVEQKVEQEINLKGSIPIEKWLETSRDDQS